MRRALLIGAVCLLSQSCAQAENWSRKEEIKKLPAEYQTLAEGCLDKGSFNCCMSSVRRMANGKYVQAGAFKNLVYECPEGYTANMLRCEDTYVWCEPVKKGNP
jgi:hypothetical protein